MIRDKEDFIDSEINSKLQELHYGESTDLHGITWSSLRSNEIPTLYEVQKWLRKTYNIAICVTPIYSYWDYTIYDLKIVDDRGYCKILGSRVAWSSYEEALNEGIKESLKFIQYE